MRFFTGKNSSSIEPMERQAVREKSFRPVKLRQANLFSLLIKLGLSLFYSKNIY